MDGEKDKPKVILKKFENYLRPRKNKRVARHRLKTRKLLAGESFDMFMKDIRILVMDCDYENPDDILIDIIIDNHHDEKVQERLLNIGEDKLTLAKAIEICQQRELSLRQMKIVRDEDAAAISSLTQKTHKPRQTRQKPGALRNTPQAGTRPKDKQGQGAEGRPSASKSTYNCKPCNKCGKDQTHKWNRGVCPAIGSTCAYCKEPDHWLAMCWKRPQVATLEVTDDEESEILSIHTMTNISMVGSGNDIWVQHLDVLNKQLLFRIDTGSKCNMPTMNTYQNLPHMGELRKSHTVLRTYSNHKLRPVAVADLSISHIDNVVTSSFEIVDVDQENVLSGDTAIALGLITRVASLDNEQTTSSENVTHDANSKILHEYPELEHTTGTLPGTYKIKLQPDVQGVVHAARRQPAALKSRIISKLHEMEKDEYIVKVEQPTEWVSSMVATVRNDKYGFASTRPI